MAGGWLDRFREAVEADGRSARAISLAAGLGPNYVSEMLTKDKEPGIDKLLRLCKEVDVSATYILTGAPVSAESEEFLEAVSDLPADRRSTVMSLVRQLKADEQ